MIPMEAVIRTFRDVESIIRRKGITDRDRYVRHVEKVMHEALQGRTPKSTEHSQIVEWADWLLTTETQELIRQLRSTK